MGFELVSGFEGKLFDSEKSLNLKINFKLKSFGREFFMRSKSLKVKAQGFTGLTKIGMGAATN